MKQLYRATFSFEGKRYSRTSAVSHQEANLKARQYKADLENGIIGITKQMQVKPWAYEWLEVYKKSKCTDKVYKHYKRYIDNLLVPEIGKMRLKDVKAIHLQKILNSWAGNSKSDIKRLRDTIRTIFQKAYQSRLINHDPSESLDMPAATDGTHRSISDVERKHFLKVSETHPAGLMFKTMLLCGLRTGEVAALSWKDIDYENQMINVVAAMESGKDFFRIVL